MTDTPITSDEQRTWTDDEPVDETDRIDARVLAEASPADAIDQRVAAPLDDPDDR